MDVYVPGCAVKPEALIDGVVKALAILDKKREAMKAHETCEVPGTADRSREEEK